jgi:hypothetical protein
MAIIKSAVSPKSNPPPPPKGWFPSTDPCRSVAVPRLRLARRRSVSAPVPSKTHPSYLYSPSCSPPNLLAPAAVLSMALQAPRRRIAGEPVLARMDMSSSLNLTFLLSSSFNVVQPFGKQPGRQRHRMGCEEVQSQRSWAARSRNSPQQRSGVARHRECTAMHQRRALPAVGCSCEALAGCSEAGTTCHLRQSRQASEARRSGHPGRRAQPWLASAGRCGAGAGERAHGKIRSPCASLDTAAQEESSHVQLRAQQGRPGA